MPIDFEQLFNCCQSCFLVLDAQPPVFRILAVNEAYLSSTMTKRSEILGRGLFEVFRDNPDNNESEGNRNLRASLMRVLKTRTSDVMPIQRYDIPDPQTGVFLERHWSPINKPVFGENGEMTAIIHRVEDVTEFMLLKRQGMELDSLTRELRLRADHMAAELHKREAERLEACKALQQSEQALEAAHARLNLTLRAARVGTWTFDLTTQSFSWDDYMHQLLGFSGHETDKAPTTYSDFVQLIHANDTGSFGSTPLSMTGAMQQLLNQEFRVAWPQGSMHYLLFRGEQMSANQLAGIAVDITSQKLLEHERLQVVEQRAQMLAEVDRQKNIFLSHISHEFRTPLTLMLGPLEESLHDKQDPLSPKQDARQRMILRNALRVLRQVNQLLTFARTQSASNDSHLEPLDLGALTNELASTFRTLIETGGLEFSVDTHAMRDPVMMDRDHYDKIVLNLLSNAFKFTSRGKITLSLRPVDQQIELKVSDTGVGISPEDVPHMFERFYRGSCKDARSIEGSGIGLALTKQLVELHGGAIRFESEPGKGTCFTVTLPMKRAIGTNQDLQLLPEGTSQLQESRVNPGSTTNQFLAEATQWLQQQTPSHSSSSSSDTILVVDDNNDMRNHLAQLLSSLGPVVTAGDATSALQVVQETRPALIVLDGMLPGMSGPELLRVFRANEALHGVPVVILSAHLSRDSSSSSSSPSLDTLEPEADDYIAKPFEVRDLMARIKVQLERSRRRHQFLQQLEQKDGELNRAEQQSKVSNATLLQQAKRQSWMEGLLLAEGERAQVLEQCKQNQERFIETLCHELRNPLNGLLGTTDVLADCSDQLGGILRAGSGGSRSGSDARTVDSRAVGELSEELRRSVDSLRSCCSHAKSILDDVLDVSKLDSHKVVLAPAAHGIVSLLEGALSMFRASASRKSINLHFLPPANPGLTLMLDGRRLTQVVVNLLSNAVKFTPSHGRVALSASFTRPPVSLETSSGAVPPIGTLSLMVEDSGPGIASDELSLLFDRFAQANVRVGAMYGGSGLGLYISKSLVSLMGGEISVTSQLGSGTTFEVTIPCEEVRMTPTISPASPSASIAQAQRASANLALLIVEDNHINQRLLKNILQKSGFGTADVVDNGQEAVAAWQARHYDLVIMDVEMPIMDGITATRELRRLEKETNRPRTAILGVSGHTCEWRIADAKEAGMDAYITKPYSRDQICQNVQRLTQNAHRK